MARTDWKRPAQFSAPEGRRRVALVVAYDGRAFCGWQSQDGHPSVQDAIRDAAVRISGDESLEVCGSGRTDSGVHARGQVAHIETSNLTIPAKAFCDGLNAFLPHTVRIVSSRDVEPSFHARYSAMAREYRYFVKKSPGRDAFSDGLVTGVRELPDLALLDSYAKVLVGTHDFTTFASAKDICPSKHRDIYESGWSMCTSMYGEDVMCFRIVGNAFLYHMVRSLVGTMLDFADRSATVDEFRAALDACDRSKAGRTALSDGLYLWRISYDPEEYRWFEEKYGK